MGRSRSKATTFRNFRPAHAKTLTAVVALYLIAHLARARRPVDRTATGQHDQLVVITDNPFLIPNLPDRRKDELSRSVRMNLDSPHVLSLHLLNTAPDNGTLYPGGKLHVYDLGWRSTFLDAIRYANAMLPPKTLFVISNADIVFAHDSVRLLARVKDPDVVVALSRHEVHEDGHATLHGDPSLSQDAWFMRTPFPEDAGFDFPMGTLGSDNKLAYLYTTLNKTLVNWCNDVVIWHFHSSQHRGTKARLPQPYEKVPNTRVNISMLDTSWKVRRVSNRFSSSLGVMYLDIPRLKGQPITMSNVHARESQPDWTDSALISMHALAKRRFRKIEKAEVYFLDVPWRLLTREFLVNHDAELAQSLVMSTPSFSFERAFALVPEELVPKLCGTRMWNKLIIGAIDDSGAFKGEVVCPPS